ncbi:glycosyltransferase family 4 protein [Devosia sp. BK]|uniref:glycosyltransferase family 4 protein n=1 Tax=Devosia sp. BK TaxID=2871706 RepID=UPI00293B64C4|nr:glycosyltransferase family 4 protein [Devosia sp. BK]MDV3253787.1 glycosyltransferase family 4 protein [Devosia sp. BK]
MPKVAIVGNQAFALLNFRAPLIEALVAAGNEVVACAPRMTEEDKSRIRELGALPLEYPLTRAGINPFHDLATLIGLLRILLAHKPDVVVSYTIKPSIYGTIAAKLAGVKHSYAMITGLGYAFTNSRANIRSKIIYRVARLLYKLSFLLSDGVVVQNNDDRNFIIDEGLISASKVKGVFPTGIKLGEWPLTPPLLIPTTFTLVARMLADKGVREFVAAAKLIKCRYPSARFLLVGGLDSNPLAIGEAEVSTWVGEKTVEWLGHVPVRPVLDETSVFVLPSYREGVPRSSQEAAALGRPIVTTDVPGCRETVIHGVNGFLVPAQDVERLREAMERFLQSPDLISTMGNESRKIAEQRFDAEKICAQLIKIFGLASTQSEQAANSDL